MQIDQNKAQLDLLQAQVRNLSMRQSSPSPAPRLCQISFQSGHATLNVHDLGKLRQLASELNRHPQLLLSINGYSDNVGDEGANTDLSQRRANSVEQALIDSGVAAGRLNTHAFGSENPAAGNTRAAGRHINRRVECVMRQTESAAAP
jgi:outer membrane protein OmpA-like peptidoglycan-associated protein